jgi:GMP synthase-like glutamine amidotransferase
VRVIAAVHQDDAGPVVFGDVVRELGHELVEWRPQNGAPPDGADAVLVFGGAMHVDQEDQHPWLVPEREWMQSLLDSRVPTLGVCLGAELLAVAAGWPLMRLPVPEIGWHDVELTTAGREDPLLGAAPPEFASLQWHSYAAGPPGGARVLAVGAACAQAYRVGERAWGIQFHAEVDAATVEHWLDDGKDDDDVREARIDIDAVRERTGREIAAWNRIGRDLCARFLELAAR